MTFNALLIGCKLTVDIEMNDDHYMYDMAINYGPDPWSVVGTKERKSLHYSNYDYFKRYVSDNSHFHHTFNDACNVRYLIIFSHTCPMLRPTWSPTPSVTVTLPVTTSDECGSTFAYVSDDISVCYLDIHIPHTSGYEFTVDRWGYSNMVEDGDHIYGSMVENYKKCNVSVMQI